MKYRSVVVLILIFLIGVRAMSGEMQGLENTIATQYSLKKNVIQVDIKEHISHFFPVGSSIIDAKQQLARSNFSVFDSKKFSNLIVATRELKRTTYSFDEIRIVLETSNGMIISMNASLLTHAL